MATFSMHSYNLLLLNVICLLSFVYSQQIWYNVTSPKMFRSDRDQAIGVYNDVITIIGGYIYGYQITEYNVTNNSMHFLGETANLYDVYTVDSGFTQINDLLYIIQYYNGYGQQISVYNLATKIFHNDINITIPLPVQWTGCLTNYIDEYLFVIGGYYTSKRKNLQIYNMTNFEWFTGPNMLRERSTLTCAVHNTLKKLYAIGGTGRTIEIISIENMYNLTYPGWYYNDPISLIDGKGNLMRSVVYEDSIFVVGGVDAEDKVQRIDCISGNISIAGYLNYPQHSGALIVYNSIIYVFSGHYTKPTPSPLLPASSIYYDIWQYTDMAPRPTVVPIDVTNVPTTSEPTTSEPTTSEPTTSIPTTSIPTTSVPTTSVPTTSEPTNIPSHTPTNIPSHTPTTNEPTSIPTNTPSNNPSEYPSLNPSLIPTKNPTMTPTTHIPSHTPTTNEPTSTPTNTPSNNPSEYPSLNPSLNPSLVPTKNPTMTPTSYPTIKPTTNEPTIPFISTRIVSDESGNIMYSIMMNICIIISIVLFV